MRGGGGGETCHWFPVSSKGWFQNKFNAGIHIIGKWLGVVLVLTLAVLVLFVNILAFCINMTFVSTIVKATKPVFYNYLAQVQGLPTDQFHSRWFLMPILKNARGFVQNLFSTVGLFYLDSSFLVDLFGLKNTFRYFFKEGMVEISIFQTTFVLWLI